jgi:DNA-binding MarR family transcriptional regulator
VRTREDKVDRFIKEFNELITFFVHLFSVVDRKEKARHHATISQCYTLRHLKDCKGLTMKQLSDSMGLATSTMTRNTDKLVKIGCLERVRGELDRREVLIRLTAKGKELVKNIQESERYFTLKVVNEIPETEWDNVLHSMNLLLKAFQKRREAHVAARKEGQTAKR